jgi:trans-aconitate methyltransferase
MHHQDDVKKIRAASFDSIADLYEQARPGYPQEVYEEIERYVSFSRTTKILEIGAGDGKATWDMYQRWQTQLTALEPGPALHGLLRKKFRGTDRVKIERTTFEEFIADETYDCVVAATAFHWVKKEVKFAKTAQLLREKGHVVLYWNNYSRNDDPIFDEIQERYRLCYPQEVKTRDIRETQAKKIDERRRELADSGYFRLVSHREYFHTKSYTAKEYVDLLRTFSENSTKDKERLSAFYDAIEDLIKKIGGRLDLPIHVNLEIGEKSA